MTIPQAKTVGKLHTFFAIGKAVPETAPNFQSFFFEVSKFFSLRNYPMELQGRL